ncbi:hypothetical protein N7449_004364 [Penicillium cf. viridicatum]|uniref:Uncharacterized protein n=1 Tax=Penicillium cf. viridicatum TaxID=2972119 RepID=A0A9W9JB16_9EURO|nr:hypothetical protein N7449_009286 [Penicillium cf. viridicatum]KAJ5202285.1 hypothetical protein N7449_004364 [Penicillium cf. viridicatum]
MVSKVKDSKAS